MNKPGYVQNEPKEIDLSEEISDPDGNEDVSTIGFEVPSGATCEETDSDGRCIKVEVPGEGTWEVEEDGKVTFAPDEDYVGDAEIDYTVLDEAGLESDPKTIELKADVEPSISLVKSGVLSADGTSIEYTFTVTNTGNVILTNVVIDDTKLGISGQMINPSTLAPDQEGTYTTTYMVTQADLDAGVVENTATTTGTPPVGDNVTAGDDENIPLGQDPSISLLKEGVLDGEEIIYTFTVQNTGNVTLTDVVVNDVMLSNDAIAVNPSTLAPDESGTATATYTVTQADLDAGIVENTATATGKDPEENDVTDEDDEDVELERDADIQLVKSGVLSEDGNTIEYTFTVTNTGNVTLTDVEVNDAMLSNDAIAVNPSILAPGATGTASVTYTVTQADLDAGVVENTATATGKDPEDNDVTDEDDEEVELERDADIQLVKSGVLSADGTSIEYTFTVTNTGNVTLTDVVIDDAKLGISGQLINPSILAPDQEGTYTATYTITQADLDAGVVENTATATGKDPEDNDVTDEDDEDVELERDPSIHLLKSGVYVDADNNEIVNPGDEIHYTFTVTNTGNVTLTDVVIHDDRIGVEDLFVTDELAPAAEMTVAFTYTITQNDINDGGVWNLAIVTGNDPDDEPVEDESEDPEPLEEDDPDYDPECPDCTFVPLEESPSIHLLKSGFYVDANGDGIVNPGDEIHYTFTVTNTGNVPLTDVTVTDPLVTVSGGPIDLDVGESNSTEFKGVYTVTQADINAGGVYNIATTTGTPPIGDPVEDDSEDPEPLDPEDPNYDEECPDCTFTELDQDPSIELVKTAEEGDYGVGDEITYTFKVTNTGNVTLSNITIEDLLPGIVISGNESPITLDPEDSDDTHFTATYTVSEDDIANRGVFNHATVTGEDPKGDEVNDDDEEDVVILVPPVAEDDEKEGGTPGNPIMVEDITENDTPGNCGPLLTETIILFSPDGTISGTSVQVAGEGTWTVDLSSGEVIFAPEQGFLDDPTPITYTVEDECEQLTGAIIRVMYDFEPPVAVDDFKDDQVPGNPVTLPIIDNDKKGNDGPLNPGTIDLIETVDETNVPSTCMTTDAEGRCIELDVPGEGTWTAHDDGSATFTPEFGFEDDPTPIKYTIEDEAGQLSNEATITILYDHEPVVTPNCGNTAPAIVSDCESVMIASDFVTNWDRDIYPLKIYVYDRWGLVIPGFPVTLYNSDQTFAIDVTAYLGERLEFSE